MSMNQIPNSLNNSQLKSIDNLINEVGQRQLKDFGQVNSDLKPDGTLITECDRWSDKTKFFSDSKLSPRISVLNTLK